MASSSDSLPKDKFLGKGAYGSVYLYYDERTKAFVAVKRIDVGPVESEDANVTKELKAVRKEIYMMKDLNHKRIIQYIRAEQESNIFSIYMEYASGGSVENELIKNGALSEDTARKYTLQLLEGLSYLHRKRIIHRDVKGSNILCDGHGNIKLADFGISRQMNQLYTLTSKASKNTARKGTAYWMAPEVIQAVEYGTRADIWSTGATVVEMLTAHPPWYGLEDFQAMFKIASLGKGGYALDSKTSRDAEDFLTQTFMLEEQRPRADELLQHPWLKAVHEDRFLGKGAYGSVYIHYDKISKAFVAVKRIDVGPAEGEDVNITKEVRALCQQILLMNKLNREQVVPFLQTEVQLGLLHIYMEYMSDGSVKDELTTHGAFNEDRARIYTAQILNGLSYLHENGITHGAVKASNIFFDGKDHIKLSDFGMSKHVGCIQTLKGETNGDTDSKSTVYWMAPEVLQGESVTNKADTWSTGATIIEMLTTLPPWHELDPYPAMYKIRTLKTASYSLNSIISSKAVNFLALIFTSEEQRPTVEDLLKHSWLDIGEHKSEYELDVESRGTQGAGATGDEDSGLSDVEMKGYANFERQNEKISLRLEPCRKKNITKLYNNTEKIYFVTDPLRGRVLIINNYTFYKDRREIGKRLGSEVDYANISQLFVDMRFQPAKSKLELTDLTADEIYKEIAEETARDEHHGLGMFVLVLMSEGVRGDYILDIDSEPVDLVRIRDTLSSYNFPAMKGKPKLFIIQASSGDRENEDEPLVANDELLVANDEPLVANDEPRKPSETSYTPGEPFESLPVDDLFVMKASAESFAATTSRSHGSWFIRILVTTFYRHACHRDLESLFKIIQQRMRETSIAYIKRTGERTAGNIPTSMCTFTNYRKLYFFPEFPVHRRRAT